MEEHEYTRSNSFNPELLSDGDSSNRPDWTNAAIMELLNFYNDNCVLMDKGVICRKKKLWEICSKAMAQKGYKFTPSHCENKWKTLKRGYYNNKTPGRFGLRLHPYDKQIQEILEKRPEEKMPVKNVKQEELINHSDPAGHGINSLEALLQDEEITVEEPMLENDGSQYLIEESVNHHILSELSELRKAVSRHNRIGLAIQQQNSETQAKLSQHLDCLAQRQNQILELKEIKMEQQKEVIKQMKVQNAILQKILDKIG